MGKIEIVIRAVGPGNYHAHFQGRESDSGIGSNESTAIGNLVRNYGSLVGITISDVAEVKTATTSPSQSA